MLLVAIPCEGGWGVALGRNPRSQVLHAVLEQGIRYARIHRIFSVVEKSSDICCQAVWQKLCKGKGALCGSSTGLGLLVSS